MRLVGNLLAVGVACSLIAACAAFQANPSASTCAAAQNDLAAAETVEAVTLTALTVAQAHGLSAGDVQKAQTDFAAAQAVVTTLQSRVAVNCASATPSSPPAKPQP